jgi:uncharacterized membrane protein YccC
MGIDWIRRGHAQLRLAVRIVTASVAAFVVGHLLGLEQSQWAVLTAVIVMQASVGASLKAMLDRFVGTVGGGVWGVTVSLGLRHGVSMPLWLALAIGIAPLAVLTAFKPAYRVAPITAIILLLTPGLQTMGPVQSALQRLLEIGVGSVIALMVSLFVLPARAHGALAQAVSQALTAMAELMTMLASGLTRPIDMAAVQAAHDRIRVFVGQAEIAADEALRERSSFLTSAADPAPICRTLRRLRHDLAILGRALVEPLPEAASAMLLSPCRDAAAAVSTFFTTSAAAIAKGRPPSPLDAVDAAFDAEAHAVTEMRRQRVLRGLADDDLTRIFGLGFALEQLHRDLRDLADRGAELAHPSIAAVGASAPNSAD